MKSHSELSMHSTMYNVGKYSTVGAFDHTHTAYIILYYYADIIVKWIAYFNITVVASVTISNSSKTT